MRDMENHMKGGLKKNGFKSNISKNYYVVDLEILIINKIIILNK